MDNIAGLYTLGVEECNSGLRVFDMVYRSGLSTCTDLQLFQRKFAKHAKGFPAARMLSEAWLAISRRGITHIEDESIGLGAPIDRDMPALLVTRRSQRECSI